MGLLTCERDVAWGTVFYVRLSVHRFRVMRNQSGDISFQGGWLSASHPSHPLTICQGSRGSSGRVNCSRCAIASCNYLFLSDLRKVRRSEIRGKAGELTQNRPPLPLLGKALLGLAQSSWFVRIMESMHVGLYAEHHGCAPFLRWEATAPVSSS